MANNSELDISFHIKKQTNQNIKYFVYHDKQYPVNFDLLKNNCNYFYKNRKQFKDIEYISLITDDEDDKIILSEESILSFISNCQNENSKISLSSVMPLNYLANKFDYPELKLLTDNCIQEHSNRLIFQKILFQSNDTSDEQFLSTHLDQFIDDDQMLQLPLPTLERILRYHVEKVTKRPLYSSEINDFLFKCLKKFGKDASILFNYVDFKEENVEFIKKIVDEYSDEFDFNMISSTLSKTVIDLTNELSKQKVEYLAVIDQMKKEFDRQINEINKMREEEEEKMKEEKLRNQQNNQKYEERIKSIQNEMENRIKLIESKFNKMIVTHNSYIQSSLVNVYNNIILDKIDYDDFMKIKDDDSRQHIIKEIIEKRNIKDDKNNNCLFNLILSCQKLIKTLSAVYHNCDQPVLIKFICDKISNKMIRINSNEVEFLFNKNLLSSCLIDACNDFGSLDVEIEYPMKDFQKIVKILYDLKNDKESKKFVFTLTIKKYDDHSRISMLKDLINVVIIEPTINEIEEEAFLGFQCLRIVTIQPGIKLIGKSSFKGCAALNQIAIPSTVTSIGDNAFNGCSSLSRITIPSSVKSIGRTVFNGITKIELSKDMTSIPSNLFKDCPTLTEITIPSTVTFIGDNAFNGCSSLSRITIPSSVTSIGDNAFNGCSSLSRITIPSSVKSIGRTVFNGITKIELSKDMTSIPSNLFKDCPTLTEITIPSTVTFIGDNAFNGCSSLSRITIPSSVKSIGDNAFDGCTSLKLIELPPSVESIGKTSFKGFESTKSFDYSQGHELSGIIRYLTDVSGGNAHDRGAIIVSSSSNYKPVGDRYGINPKYLCDFNDLSMKSMWSPKDEQNATISFDFKQRKIKMTHYTLHTPYDSEGTSNFCYPKSWKVECSNDLSHWCTVDNRNNEEIMKNGNVCHTFNCQSQSDEFYQHVRIMPTDADWKGKHYFDISAVEFYGVLKEIK